LHFFLIKRKDRGLNTKRLHKNFFLGIISLYQNPWKKSCGKGRVGQGGNGLIPDSLGKERLTGRKR
jgi:hypothetical protein